MGKMAAQFDLEPRASTGGLESVWVEVPSKCNLACPWCFTSAGEPLHDGNLLARPHYELLLNEAHAMRVSSLGIPGAGEPLLPGENQKLTRWLVDQAAQRGMFVTLFTTAQWIDAELASWLLKRPVELMIKGATLDPDKMDRFVSDPKRGRVITGYGQARNKALELLIGLGFNSPAQGERWGRQTRLGLVLSLMEGPDGLSNLDDAIQVLQFCRRNEIVFDADSLLHQGRGANCDFHVSDEVFQDAVRRLQEVDRQEFGVRWAQDTPAYVGTTCDRHRRHLNINQHGGIRPCLGATGVNLGNIRHTTLQAAWDHPAMKVIRERRYGGKCATCALFQGHRCNSCLGRCTEGLCTESIERTGEVLTTGCWNHQPAT